MDFSGNLLAEHIYQYIHLWHILCHRNIHDYKQLDKIWYFVCNDMLQWHIHFHNMKMFHFVDNFQLEKLRNYFLFYLKVNYQSEQAADTTQLLYSLKTQCYKCKLVLVVHQDILVLDYQQSEYMAVLIHHNIHLDHIFVLKHIFNWFINFNLDWIFTHGILQLWHKCYSCLGLWQTHNHRNILVYNYGYFDDCNTLACFGSLNKSVDIRFHNI